MYIKFMTFYNTWYSVQGNNDILLQAISSKNLP
jgi:hypothetical protein